MKDIFGNRKISIARELTKNYEEIITSDLNDIEKIIEKREKNKDPLKGEVVLIVEGFSKKELNFDILSTNIKDRLKKQSLRDTVNDIVIETRLPKKFVYNEAVKIKNNKSI